MYILMDMTSERKKQPDRVRRNLIDCAARLAAEQGFSAVSVQAVAAAAGVTKGGLFHHFASKQALLEAVLGDILETLDADIDALISQDRDDYGCFTRAYVNAFFADRGRKTYAQWSALSVALISEPSLRQRWESWMGGRLTRHKKTDGDVGLELVRLAVDGVWLADLMSENGHSGGDREALRKRLIRAARKENLA
ncbi:TetR/AcrR family transcriptional regulator [Agrobacterium rubi]|nr:TetR/AcrR family transcriptional regulator [Agrobacterium rubi]OCJ55211.1 TetR family transcriptional regulator [Agrobacterium rubi]